MNPPTPVCHKCKAKGVRLYRPSLRVYADKEIRCNSCISEQERKFYSPLLVLPDGSRWLCNEEATNLFLAKDEADSDCLSWAYDAVQPWKTNNSKQLSLAI